LIILTRRALPQDVIAKTKLFILDTPSVMAEGARTPRSFATARVAADITTRPCHCVILGRVPVGGVNASSQWRVK
jgi:hypothetical protein